MSSFESKRRKKQIQIPPFYGDFDPDTYLEWEKEMDLIIKCQGYTAENQAQLASTGLCGYALDWWYQLANNRRRIGEFQVSSWYEMKAVMKKRFVAKRYGQLDQERLQSQSRSARAHPHTSTDDPKVCYGRGDQKKNQKFGHLHSQQFQDANRKKIQQAVNALVQNKQRRPDNDTLKPPAIQPPAGDKQLDENFGSWSTQQTINKNTKQTSPKPLSKPAEKDPESAPEPATPCQGDYLAKHLKQEERSSVICDHVPGENQPEEGVLNGSPKAHELAITTVVEEGDIIESFSCDLLTKPPVWIQTSIMERMRFVKGLQHLVFEPGGSFCVHKSITNTLIQIAAALKLYLEGFLNEQEEPMVVSGESKLRSRSQKYKIKACVWYQWREAQSKAIRSELNKEQKFLALSVTCNEHSPVKHIGRVKALQSFVFEPGGDINVHKSFNNTKFQRETYKLRLDSLFILEELDLRTNPFKGGGNGATWISFKIMFWKPMHAPERHWVISQPNGLMGEFIGVIQDVLEPEKVMELDEAFIKHGMTLDNHGRPVRTLVDKEMDGIRLVGQEMEWAIQCDREMDWSNRHGREMSWKWKMKNQSWKWNMRGIFIIQMSIRSNLVGPGTRWIEPKKELFEKGLYRPKKWKDKPAWFMIGP